MSTPFITIPEAIEIFKAGKMLILVDDEDRENEGDLVIAAEFADADAINFMAKFGRGLICLPMAASLIEQLELPMMATQNRSPYGTAFTVSIEASSGVSTGISAQDRAHTIQVAIDPHSNAKSLITPGHIFPLKARKGGVLERPGQTEGSVDLAQLSELRPAAVICEIMNDDGTMSRREDLIQFSKIHDIPLVSIRDLIHYRIKHEKLIEALATSRIPLAQHGDFEMTVYQYALEQEEHFALIKEWGHDFNNPLVRIHSECITGDVFGSCKCDCGTQLQQSLAQIAKEGGILIYLRQEGRGIGLANKLKAYALQEKGLDTVEANIKLGLPADKRDYAVAYQMLKDLKVKAVRLLTNNPKKVEALEQYGIQVDVRVPLTTEPTSENRHYLKTKQEKMGHLLTIE